MGDADTPGWFDWAYRGVDHSLSGNGGLACRDFLSIPQRWLESITASAIAFSALMYAWPRLSLPRPLPGAFFQKPEPLGKRILLLLMCLTFGIELGFKFATRQMIWIWNPCHLATMMQIFILAAPPGRTVIAAFRLHMHMLTGAPIAILFPVINTRLLPFETGVYYLQHILMLVIPFYLMYTGDPFIPEPLGDISWALTAFALLFIYHFIPLQLLAYVSHVNLNNMLCPAVSDPFHGKYYRLFAIFHQFILILVQGKLLVMIARAFNLIPRTGTQALTSTCACKSPCQCRVSSSKIHQISSSNMGDFINDGRRDYSMLAPSSDQKKSKGCSQSRICGCGGDSNALCFSNHSLNNCGGSSEFRDECRDLEESQTVQLINGEVTSGVKDLGENYCRKRPIDVSSQVPGLSHLRYASTKHSQTTLLSTSTGTDIYECDTKLEKHEKNSGHGPTRSQ